jgi:hypothetical protein
MNDAPESNYSVWLAKAENDFLNIENNLQAARGTLGYCLFSCPTSSREAP